MAAALLTACAQASADEPRGRAECAKALDRAYNLKGWKHEPKDVRGCRHLAQRERKLNKAFREYGIYRRHAPFDTPIGFGRPSPSDFRHSPIPWPVLCGESHPDQHGKASWHINADGAFQIIPSTWGGFRGYSTAGAAPPLIQIIRADQLWGTTPWYGLC